MDTFKPIADIAMRKVNRVAPQEIRMAFQDGVTTGVKFVNGTLMLIGAAEIFVDLKDNNPEAGMKVIKSGKQILEYLFPELKIFLCSIENLCTFSKSVDEIMSKEEMSDEDKGNALVQSSKDLFKSQIENSPNLKFAQEVVKSEKVVKEVKELNKSRQVEKDAIKKFAINIAKLIFPTVGILIDATTIPKRCLVLAKKFGVEKLFENYSQTDIDADGQISWGVPGLESNKDDVDKQNTVSDTKKQEQKSDSDVVVKVKVTDSDPLEQAKELEPISESKNRFLSIISDNFQQAEGFQVNEEKDPDELQEICNAPTLPETEKKLGQAWLCISKATKEYKKGIFPTYSPIDVDIDGHEILGIWEA